MLDASKNTLFINFKNYEEAVMQNSLPLARTAEKIAKETGKQIVLVVNTLELEEIAKSVSNSVFCQHLDFQELGKGTGKVLPEIAKHCGATGTVLNHAEFKLSNEVLEKTIQRAKQAGLLVMACAESTERATEIARMPPKVDFIAIEPPELIGSKEVSVSTAKPELISETVREIEKIASIPVITGAGIKNAEDVKIALKLGTKGVFVASSIVKAEDKENAIKEIAKEL